MTHRSSTEVLGRGSCLLSVGAAAMTPIYQITIYQCGKMLAADVVPANTEHPVTIYIEPHGTYTGLMDSVAIAINDRKEGDK